MALDEPSLPGVFDFLKYKMRWCRQKVRVAYWCGRFGSKKRVAVLPQPSVFLVEQIGIEPTASSVRGMRSPS